MPNNLNDPNKNQPLSVIIPTLNEIEALPKNLALLLQDPLIGEIIVVDGGSIDGTQAYVRAQTDPRVSLLASAPGRGRQMNLGANRATGDWLVFHHADSLLPDSAGESIASLSDTVYWGGFRHEFSNSNWKLRMISALHNWRCGRSGVIYGDQSMFVRRRFFFDVQGFNDTGLEDLAFSDVALEQAPSRLLDAAVITDSRKFRQIGELRGLLHVISIVLRYERQKSVGNQKFFKPYR